MKSLYEKYSYQIKILILFFSLYMFFFHLLEIQSFQYILYTESFIDQYIPFNEYFVIPYLLWFVFISLGFLYFLFIDKKGFYRTCYYLFVGMSISLFIYIIIPNGQNLRVELLDTNIYQQLVHLIYSLDSSTNVCPSIHVYNSIMMMLSLLKSSSFKKHKKITLLSLLLTFLICLSTMLIKQHAFIDVVCAIMLCIVVYELGKRIYGF